VKNWFIALFATLTVLGGVVACHADSQPLQWQIPYFGLVNLNLSTTEMLVGYDAVLKEAVGGASLPLYTDPKGIIALQVGAVAPWPVGGGATVQPYLAAGHDIAREIPGLSQYQSLHVNIFARYATDVGKAGVGLGVSYSMF
jgi:hypothetical protein